MSKIRILLSDDHVLMRMGLATLISCEDDMQVVGEAKNGRQAVELTHALKPDLVIMDLMMPELSGAEATKLIHDAYPKTKILVLTSYGTSREMSEAINNGANGVLMKDTATDDLISAIRTVLTGEQLIPERLLRLAAEDNASPKLTNRQLEILTSIARGLSNSDIAHQFGVSEITIKKQLSSIFERLGVSNRAEAVALALRKHILQN